MFQRPDTDENNRTADITPLSLPVSAPVEPDAGYASSTVIVYGDSRDGEAQHRGLVNLMDQLPFQAVIHVGDVAYYPDDQVVWETFMEITAPLRDRAPFWIIAGNHDTPEDQFEVYFPDEAGNHLHTVNDVSFLFLDLERGIDEAAQFVRDHATVRTIVITHYPLYTGGPHRTDSLVQKAQALHEIFLENHIQLVFSGHDHNYQRIERDGISYLVTGGGGAPLYSVSDIEGLQSSAKANHFVILTINQTSYTIRTVDIDGTVIDETVIPSPDPNS
ncbi:hypothetical protein AUK40_01430 [Candidatus Wirthbacteria bacterium CG2_30_54_11]|uniref:Calcineurin-like phosphoesterase domain-containing protein n=1 Tax=Candidatus Wirthbacteria bacterium CG2_30_54_11 TaxID=1817892 RepID=A0A1J5IVW1_9BACT|nr:MAG: hypothetical protein AUK40_01430 [Candidatus Wirthbacteria bacterium CG2_30_54_11]